MSKVSILIELWGHVVRHGPFHFSVDKQKINRSDIRSTEEVGCMKKSNAPLVRCEYSKAEKSLSHLVEESFRLYLNRILAQAGKTVVSCGR